MINTRVRDRSLLFFSTTWYQSRAGSSRSRPRVAALRSPISGRPLPRPCPPPSTCAVLPLPPIRHLPASPSPSPVPSALVPARHRSPVTCVARALRPPPAPSSLSLLSSSCAVLPPISICADLHLRPRPPLSPPAPPSPCAALRLCRSLRRSSPAPAPSSVATCALLPRGSSPPAHSPAPAPSPLPSASRSAAASLPQCRRRGITAAVELPKIPRFSLSLQMGLVMDCVLAMSGSQRSMYVWLFASSVGSLKQFG